MEVSSFWGTWILKIKSRKLSNSHLVSLISLPPSSPLKLQNGLQGSRYDGFFSFCFSCVDPRSFSVDISLAAFGRKEIEIAEV